MGGEHTASPVYADGRIYFLDVKGAGHVVSADREGQVLARNHLDEGCMASPAIVGKAVYVRTKPTCTASSRSQVAVGPITRFPELIKSPARPIPRRPARTSSRKAEVLS